MVGCCYYWLCLWWLYKLNNTFWCFVFLNYHLYTSCGGKEDCSVSNSKLLLWEWLKVSQMWSIIQQTEKFCCIQPVLTVAPTHHTKNTEGLPTYLYYGLTANKMVVFTKCCKIISSQLLSSWSSKTIFTGWGYIFQCWSWSRLPFPVSITHTGLLLLM